MDEYPADMENEHHVASSAAAEHAHADTHATPQKAEEHHTEEHAEHPAAGHSAGKSKRMGIPGLAKYIFSREAGGVMSHPSFKLVNEETGAAVLIARKKQMRSPHVYLYSVNGDKNTPMKKLRETEKLEGVLMASSDLTEYRLVIDENGQVEVAGAAFDKTSIFTEMMHGFQPRRLSGIIPQMDPVTRRPKPHSIANGGTSLALHLRAHDVDDNPNFVVLRTKEPVFQDGCYRLNFFGRASVPSVKNFQVFTYKLMHLTTYFLTDFTLARLPSQHR
jgi:Tub family